MPSRKRAKGKGRKLKQQAREQPTPSPNGGNINLPEQDISRIEDPEFVECNHGDFEIPPGHPANDFIDSFTDALNCENFNASTIKDSLKMTKEKHRENLKDFAVRRLVIDLIVSMGTDLIIKKLIESARQLCEIIILLEPCAYEKPFQEAFPEIVADLTYILNDAKQTDVIHFYKKRIPCSCLDKLYSEIKKSQDRGSDCSYCKQTIKRKDIKACNRCKCTLYCSKECQISDWPSHKEWCKDFCSIPKSLKKAETTRKNEEG